MARIDGMVLYMKPGCPYCAKVQRYLDAHGIEVETRNVFEGGNLLDLMEVGGKNQAPCLVVDGTALYESEDIIAFFAAR